MFLFIGNKIKDNIYADILDKSAEQQKKSHKRTVIKKFKEQHLKIEKKDTEELSPVIESNSDSSSSKSIKQQKKKNK